MDYEKLLSTVVQTGAVHRFPNLELAVGYLPLLNLAFSSTGEDLWLRQFMKPKLRAGTPGFYVDLGANEPMITSTTFLFYSYGWRGVCIDANARFRDKFQTHRPRDIFVNAAISDADGPSLFFAEHKRFLTMSRVRDSEHDFDHDFLPAIKVPTRTMADVLGEHVPQNTEIDFMSIDIEGSELPALRSNDWDTYKPRIILIEVNGATFDPLHPLDFPTIALLHEKGYRYEGYANHNVLMTSPHYTPPE